MKTDPRSRYIIRRESEGATEDQASAEWERWCSVWLGWSGYEVNPADEAAQEEPMFYVVPAFGGPRQ